MYTSDNWPVGHFEYRLSVYVCPGGVKMLSESIAAFSQSAPAAQLISIE